MKVNDRGKNSNTQYRYEFFYHEDDNHKTYKKLKVHGQWKLSHFTYPAEY